jgi:hypothetical protein
MKELKNGTFKYRNVTVAPTPLAKYPEMVTIIKAPKRMNELLGKKFINLKFTKIAIETIATETLIDSGVKSVNKELESILLGSNLNG